LCGIIGIYGSKTVFPELFHGLLTLQHRGQDAAGILTYDRRMYTKKGLGLVNDVFTRDDAKNLIGTTGIGFTRYPTAGSGLLEETV